MANARNWLIDHTGIGAADIHRSERFYTAALGALGIKTVMRFSREFAPLEEDSAELGGVAYGIDFPVFWIDVFHPAELRQHFAFRAETRAQVDDFHRAALAAGGSDNGAPGLRAGGYPPGYYAAFVLDPDGNNVEAVCREQT